VVLAWRLRGENVNMTGSAPQVPDSVGGGVPLRRRDGGSGRLRVASRGISEARRTQVFEPERVVELAGEMQTLAVEGGLPYRQATAGVLLGWARSALGNPAAGCHDLETALAAYRRTGAASELPY
jgi:hypothetical protein